MKKLIACLILSAMTQAAFCESFGVVDYMEIGSTSPQSLDARKRMQDEFKPRQEQLDAKMTKLRETDEKLRRDGEILAKADKEKLEREFHALQEQFEQDELKFRQDIQDRQAEEEKKLNKLFTDVIAEVAKAEKLDIILPAHGTLYAVDKLNVTAKVMTSLKKLPIDKSVASVNSKK